MVVSVFHSRASATNPLQLQNSTMFFEVTWPSSSEFGHTSLIGAFNLCRPHALAFQCIFVGSSSVSTPTPFSTLTFFSLLERSFSYGFFSFSPVMRVCTWVPYQALLSGPIFVLLCSSLCFTYGGVLVCLFRLYLFLNT
jgi:hypothetical protein